MSGYKPFYKNQYNSSQEAGSSVPNFDLLTTVSKYSNLSLDSDDGELCYVEESDQVFVFDSSLTQWITPSLRGSMQSESIGFNFWHAANTLSLDDDDPVDSLLDISGNSAPAVQESESNRPLFKTSGAFGGDLPYLEFSRTSQRWMSIPGALSCLNDKSEFTYAAAFKLNAASTFNPLLEGVISGGTNAQDSSVLIYQNTSGVIHLWGENPLGQSADSINLSAGVGDWVIAMFHRDFVNKYGFISKKSSYPNGFGNVTFSEDLAWNGLAENTDAGDLESLELCRSSNPSFFYSDIHLGEHIFTSSVTSQNSRLAIFDYLVKKYAV